MLSVVLIGTDQLYEVIFASCLVVNLRRKSSSDTSAKTSKSSNLDVHGNPKHF